MSNYKKVHCNNCNGLTNHTSLFQKEHNCGYDEYSDFSWGEEIRVWQCNGCESLTFENESSNSYTIDQLTGEPVSTYQYYPPRFTRSLPKWLYELSNSLDSRELFKEVYTALHNKCRRIATMGIRALIDIYIQDKVGDMGTFSNGLEELFNQRHISSIQKETIAIAVDAGNASAHRSFNPDEEILETVLDIVESLYHFDVLAKKSTDVERVTPSRIN